MKTIAKQYFETLAKIQSAKPRSRRKIVLTHRLVNLMTRQLRKENRTS